MAGVEGRDAEGRVVERQALKALINRDTAMLFMKGAPEAPRCGGSRGCVIVGLLNEVEGVKYGYYDILGDEQVRKRAGWPQNLLRPGRRFRSSSRKESCSAGSTLPKRCMLMAS